MDHPRIIKFFNMNMQPQPPQVQRSSLQEKAEDAEFQEIKVEEKQEEKNGN
jgi:hypothetical protein